METATNLMAMVPLIGTEKGEMAVSPSHIPSLSESCSLYLTYSLAEGTFHDDRLRISGTFEDVTVLNSPVQAISVSNVAALLIDGVTVDNSAGDADDLGHNTDGFDVSGNDVTIQNSVVKNQDDCIAINGGSNIIFRNNRCSGGHGISIGSIGSGKTVSNVVISGNTVTNSMFGMRIKVDADATSGGVSNVVYEGNNISGITCS